VFAVTTTTPGRAAVEPDYDRASNLATAGAVRALVLANGVPHVLVVSSGGTVYGRPAELPVPETAPTDPISAYGATRLAIEDVFRQESSFRTTVLRVGNAFGEWQHTRRDQGAAGVFLGHLLRGEPIEIWGDGSIVRDYVYVGDVARAAVLALRTETSAVLNVGSGQGRSLMDLLAACADVAGREPVVEWRPARPFDVPEIVLSIERIRAELAWEPEVALEEGLRREVEWLRMRTANVA
jgi:UDP-glucose 4-epimerase